MTVPPAEPVEVARAEGRPIEVAIIGGGCAGLTTAFDLTRPALRGRYRVTVYQQGWRLGGKGASGRGPGDRIEEHGLHIWMGFYENAFRIIRECYEELGRDPGSCRIARWDQAFVPDRLTGVVETYEGQHWLAYFPPGGGTPGDPDARIFSLPEYLVRAVQLLQALLRSARGDIPTPESLAARFAEPLTPAQLIEEVARFLRLGQLATLTGILQGLDLLAIALPGLARMPESPLLALLDRVADATRAQLRLMLESDRELRRIHEIVDLVLAILRGSLRHGLAVHPEGFDAINEYDWREWLHMNGASKESVESPFLHSLYDLAFAYENGDKSRPRAAAGDALRCAVRAFLTYRGAFFWKMQSGMGDVVFAPLYEVLRRRGVRFEFFHRLENLKLADEAEVPAGEPPWLEALEFDVQARTYGGVDYEPLIDVRGLPCWPAAPRWDQLSGGAALKAAGIDMENWWDRRCVGRRTLRVGEDFDLVVLATGGGAVRHVASELVARIPRWEEMVEHTQSIATQAFQIWMREPMEAIGWSQPSVNITAFDGTFETWADMRQLIPEESFAEPPKAIAYFCSSLETEPDPSRSDTGFPDRVQQRVRDDAVAFLAQRIGALWPGAARAGSFRWELLLAPDGNATEGPSAFATQFWTANVNPTDRYTLCLPGSSKYRISPLDMDVDNLVVAGDWTACGLNYGCVESAVISGRLAAHAIAGSPALGDIVGFDHP